MPRLTSCGNGIGAKRGKGRKNKDEKRRLEVSTDGTSALRGGRNRREGGFSASGKGGNQMERASISKKEWKTV
jgi:hypothetical protein